MGGAVQQIANAVTRPQQDVIKQVSANPAGAIGGAAAGSMIGAGPWGSAAGAFFGSEPGQEPQAPATPGIDPNLQRLKDSQIKNAKEFRAAMPENKRKMGEDLKVQSNQAMSQAMRQTDESNSSRGLLYSGINQGQKQGVRGRAQAGLASGIAGINTDLENAANTLDTQAIETGMGIQQQQQAIQNQVYSQALARMNANNQMIGSGIGAIGTGLLLGAKGG